MFQKQWARQFKYKLKDTAIAEATGAVPMPLICITKISSNQCLSHLLSALIKLSLISHSMPFEYLHSGKPLV